MKKVAKLFLHHQLKNIILMMKGIEIFILLLFVVNIQSYAIQGAWKSKDYPNVVATVTPYQTALDGFNEYKLSIDTCQFIYKVKIIESYMKIINVQDRKPTDICTSKEAKALLNEL